MISFGHTDEDLNDVLNDMRKRDEIECEYLYPGISTAFILRDSVGSSNETFTFSAPGTPGCMGIGGVFNHPKVVGYLVWFVATNAIEDISVQKYLFADAVEFMGVLTTRYPRLCNYCIADPVQLRILNRLGFDIYETVDPNVRYFECVS